MVPDITIIIPCYNSGKFLLETIESVLLYAGKKTYEIIIVNDGSKDKFTLSLLDKYSKEGHIVLHQQNKGPAAARNYGVLHAQSEYLLFLDSDNKIRPAYIDRGIEILDKYPDVGVVYGNPAFFGDIEEARFNTKPFNYFSILMNNYIDMCTVIRKATWAELNGFDEARILFGHEDWEFWIRVGDSKWKFHYVDEVLFDYRVRHNSLSIESSQSDNILKMREYVYVKHMEIFFRCYEILYYQFVFYKRDQGRPIQSFVKFIYRKFTSKNKEDLMK